MVTAPLTANTIKSSAIRSATVVSTSIFLGACAIGGGYVPDPPIRQTIAKQKAPSAEKIDVRKTQRIDRDPQSAIENYRKLLELLPENERIRLEAKRRLADLQIEVTELDPTWQEQQQKQGIQTKSSITLYQELLTEDPNDKNNDRVLYQLARAYQNEGKTNEAVDTLAQLAKQHPQSNFLGDARFRRAELLFNNRRYEEAEEEYGRVMDLADGTPFFEQAQYKKGWSRFKRLNYEGAIDIFLDILARELPAEDIEDQAAAIARVETTKQELVKDVFRVVSLSFAYMDGGKAITEYLADKPALPYHPLFYVNLAELYFEKERYIDTANTYLAFSDRDPMHPRAPVLQARSIDVYEKAGFADLMLEGQTAYVERYGFDQPFWTGTDRINVPVAVETLRRALADLSRYHHATAQKTAESANADGLTADQMADIQKQRLASLEKAGGYYAKYIDWFRDSDDAPELNYLYAESLLDRGLFDQSGLQYSETAWNYPPHPRSAEAGYGAAVAYRKYAESQGDHLTAADQWRQSVDTARRFADDFGSHNQAPNVLTQAAEDLYAMKLLEEAITVSGQLLARQPVIEPGLQRTAHTVSGYSRFDLGRFKQAEESFTAVRSLSQPEEPIYSEIAESLASAIYKQAEQAKEAGELRTAAGHFLRVRTKVPESSIIATADFDGAATLLTLEDWAAAIKVLEDFRQLYPQHEYIADVDRKLAASYLKNNQPIAAANAFVRIAYRQEEPLDRRREASWKAATLYDEHGEPVAAAAAYENYVAQFPQPMDRVLDAQSRLIELAEARGDFAGQMFWLQALVNTDLNAGEARTDRSKLLGSQANLKLAEAALRTFRSIKLADPLQATLPAKKNAMQAALQAYEQAAAYGFKESATQATFRVGELYYAFATELMDSERPAGLNELELGQYDILLEEQAFPFEEKAIDVHAVNSARISDGLYDEWVQASMKQLADLLPVRYGKKERVDAWIESIQ